MRTFPLVLTYIIFSGLLTASFILSSFNLEQNLKVIVAFSLMYIVTAVPMLAALLMGYTPIEWFRPFQRNDFIHIFFCFCIMFLIAFLSIAVFPYPVSAYVAAFGSGMILFFFLFRTKTIIVPFIAHGSFNSGVLILPALAGSWLGWDFSWLSLLTTFVPNMGLAVGNIPAVMSEVILQYTFVAPAEEFLKLAAASVLVSHLLPMSQTISKHLDKRWIYWLAAAIAVLFWVSLHAYQAYV